MTFIYSALLCGRHGSLGLADICPFLEAGNSIVPIVQVRKLRYKAVK